MRRLAGLFVCAAVLLSVAVPALGADAALVAVDDQVTTDGKTIHIYVLANDSGAIDPATLTIVTVPSMGSAVVVANGAPRVKYTTAEGAAGVDSFQYEICDTAGGCASATVTINVGSATSTTTTAAPETTTTTVPPAPSINEAMPAPADSTDTPPSPITTIETAVVQPLVEGLTSPILLAAPAPSIVPVVPPIADLSLRLDLLAEMAFAAPTTYASGTTIGEPVGVPMVANLLFLGRSGGETLRLVAIPAVLVSGVVGFLLTGFPQHMMGAVLGLLVGRRGSGVGRVRRREIPSRPAG
ncbi:MAG: Ig-like domain-containing protein [Actinomycetota bacterium]